MSQALSQEDRGRAEGRGAAWARAQPQPDMPNACPWAGNYLKTLHLIPSFLDFILHLNVQKPSGSAPLPQEHPCSVLTGPHSFLPLELQGPH